MLPGSAKKTSRQREAPPAPVQEELAAAAKKPDPEPVTVNLMEPGRPYRAFVESRLTRYLRDNNIRSLVKLAREEIRTAAMQNPPVYFYHEMSKSGDYYPVARPDSLMRGDYVLDMGGRRITDDDCIHPWPYPDRHPDISGLIDQQRACTAPGVP